MKMYKRLLLTYIEKYKRVDFGLLCGELKMSEGQIADIIYSLWQSGYVQSTGSEYALTESGRKWAFSFWNDWSVCQAEGKKQQFQWDALYIPEDFERS